MRKQIVKMLRTLGSEPSYLSFTPDGKIIDSDEKPSLFLTEEFFRMMESGL
jgi:hypothetical protein